MFKGEIFIISQFLIYLNKKFRLKVSNFLTQHNAAVGHGIKLISNVFWRIYQKIASHFLAFFEKNFFSVRAWAFFQVRNRAKKSLLDPISCPIP